MSGVVQDGYDVTQGSMADAPASSSVAEDTTPRTLVSILKAIKNILISGIAATITGLLTPDKYKTLKAVTITTIATVWTPASGKKVRLMGGCISVSAAASVLFEDNAAGTDVFQSPKLAADSPYNFDLANGVLLSAGNNLLKATSSAAATITGTLYGKEES